MTDAAQNRGTFSPEITETLRRYARDGCGEVGTVAAGALRNGDGLMAGIGRCISQQLQPITAWGLLTDLAGAGYDFRASSRPIFGDSESCGAFRTINTLFPQYLPYFRKFIRAAHRL